MAGYVGLAFATRPPLQASPPKPIANSKLDINVGDELQQLTKKIG